MTNECCIIHYPVQFLPRRLPSSDSRAPKRGLSLHPFCAVFCCCFDEYIRPQNVLAHPLPLFARAQVDRVSQLQLQCDQPTSFSPSKNALIPNPAPRRTLWHRWPTSALLIILSLAPLLALVTPTLVGTEGPSERDGTLLPHPPFPIGEPNTAYDRPRTNPTCCYTCPIFRCLISLISASKRDSPRRGLCTLANRKRKDDGIETGRGTNINRSLGRTVPSH